MADFGSTCFALYIIPIHLASLLHTFCICGFQLRLESIVTMAINTMRNLCPLYHAPWRSTQWGTCAHNSMLHGDQHNKELVSTIPCSMAISTMRNLCPQYHAPQRPVLVSTIPCSTETSTMRNLCLPLVDHVRYIEIVGTVNPLNRSHPWTRANPWIRAKLQLCKPVVFD